MTEPPAEDRAASDRTAPDEEPEVNQPGLGRLREAVANRTWRQLPGRARFREDGIAGLNSAVVSVPSGMAAGLLAGVNPLHGLYAAVAGPVAGSLLSSAQLMVITSTAATALTAGQSLAGLSAEERTGALFLMVILSGVLQALFGVLKLGRMVRFISYSVMTSFIAGIAVLLILSQLPTVTGYEATGGNSVAQAIDLLGHLGEVDPWTLALAALTFVLAVVLPRTRLGNSGSLVAIVFPSLLAVLFGLRSVEIVQDVGDIPSGVPTPFLPVLSDISLDVLTGALSVAVVVLVQGAGVSQSVPNPDGSRSNASRDFLAQGAANVASGLFQGLPVGGSLSATAVNVVSDARSRWAGIFAGLWMAIVVLVFPSLVSYTAMPALGALLILAGFSLLKVREVLEIWNAGWTSVLAGATTFLATLFLPIQAAVGIGVVLSALLYVNKSSTDVSVVELVRRSDGRIEERKPVKHLPSGAVTVLDVYGSLFYAGARTLERHLPLPREDAEHPVVVLRLRSQKTLGATLVDVLSNYADRLKAVDGRLYLTGVSERAFDQVVESGRLRLSGPVRAYEVTPIVGESTHAAVEDAQAWLVDRHDDA